jgi:integrase/recombinase XerC/integrase/recombinase XerD
VLISDCLSKFLNYQLSIGNTHKTIIAYLSHINQFVYYCYDNLIIDIEDVTYNTYENYIIFLRQKDISSVTIHSYSQSLKTFFGYCFKNGFLKENLFDLIKLPKYNKKAIQILSYVDIDRVLTYFDSNSFIGSRNILIMVLMLDCGLRLNEVINLSLTDFKFDNNVILVNGKGQKQRYVPLTIGVKKAFNNYMLNFENSFPPINPFFVSELGIPINQECVKSFFRRMRKDLHIENLHPHLLRHTFATLFLINGGDPISLQLILGHTTLTMTQKYVHFATEFQISNQCKFSPLSQKK